MFCSPKCRLYAHYSRPILNCAPVVFVLCVYRLIRNSQIKLVVLNSLKLKPNFFHLCNVYRRNFGGQNRNVYAVLFGK